MRNFLPLLILVLATPALPQGSIDLEMVFVTGGPFAMGGEVAEDEKPVRQVEVDGFFIDRTEVTVGEFRRFRPYYLALPGRESMPITSVTWADARAYCKSVGKRLPTEAEWEKACRGAEGLTYPWGDEVIPNVLNSIETGLNGPAPVSSYRLGASPYGAVDMAGNVWEWTADWYAPYPGAAAQQPTKEFEKYRVIRGGSFAVKGTVARCGNRFVSDPKLDSADIGFRCARTH